MVKGMKCVASVAHDKHHYKFMCDITKVFDKVFPGWKGVVDEGGRFSQESWFRVMVKPKDYDLADELMDWIAQHTRISDKMIDTWKEDHGL